MLSDVCSKALAVWKRLMLERFSELNIDIDIHAVISGDDGFIGRMCNSCVSALYRFQKLELSTHQSINDAVDAIVTSHRCSFLQSRKRNMDDDDDETSSSNASKSRRIMPQLSSTCHFPDVAVSYKNFLSDMHT